MQRLGTCEEKERKQKSVGQVTIAFHGDLPQMHQLLLSLDVERWGSPLA